jgi:hypothetical protein
MFDFPVRSTLHRMPEEVCRRGPTAFLEATREIPKIMSASSRSLMSGNNLNNMVNADIKD